ncbi:MAG TPA: cupin domain-containing protein [Burkholderiaceae bacterium]|jgi:quercetin dioxygenase-like cupin family protein|nr:cupin domain-containing protein [Burkholderiaceae bacterium]
MAIPHARSGQVVDILSPDDSLPSDQSYAVFKSDQLEVMRLMLPAGKAFPPHRVAGEITMQCLAGRVELDVEGVLQVLHPGQLTYLEGGVEHGLVAIEDAMVLVTIVLCRP